MLLHLAGVFHLELIVLLVGLGPRTVHRRPLAEVEHAELQPGLIDHLSHGPAQRVDLADNLPLGDASNGGIATHLRHGVAIHGQQRGAGTQSRRRQSRLTTGVACSDHDHVKLVTRTAHRPASSPKAPI